MVVVNAAQRVLAALRVRARIDTLSINASLQRLTVRVDATSDYKFAEKRITETCLGEYGFDEREEHLLS